MALQVPGIADEDQGVFLVVLSLIGVAAAALVLAAIYFWATGRQAQRRFELKLIEDRLAPAASEADPSADGATSRRRRRGKA